MTVSAALLIDTYRSEIALHLKTVRAMSLVGVISGPTGFIAVWGWTDSANWMSTGYMAPRICSLPNPAIVQGLSVTLFARIANKSF